MFISAWYILMKNAVEVRIIDTNYEYLKFEQTKKKNFSKFKLFGQESLLYEYKVVTTLSAQKCAWNL